MNRGELLRMSGLPVYQNKMYLSAQADQVFVMDSNYLGEITRAGDERLHYISVESP
jgi:hypothetical protein